MDEPRLHFVISAPRSGSTWLINAINHHPQLFGTEQRLFGDFCEVWQNNDGTTAPRITLDKYASAFGMHYFYQYMNRNYDGFVEDFKVSMIRFLLHFAKNRTGKDIVVDKITPYPGTASLVVSEIRRLFPASKIILLMRDGRDVLTSGAFDWLLKDAQGTDRHRFYVQRPAGMALRRFFDDALITKWAHNWRETIDTLQAGAAADGLITYEGMKNNFDQSIASLFRVLGVDDSAEICQQCQERTTFQAATGRSAGDHRPTAKTRKGVAGDWKNYFTRRDGQLFSQLAGQQLQLAQYVTSDHWWDELPEQLDLTHRIADY